jgi:diguanylate cyclase (GGDEF)-like protein
MNFDGRKFFELAVAEAFCRPARERSPFMIGAFGVDGFPRISESYGFDVGEQLLRRVARTVWTSVGTQGVVARLGWNRFGVLCGLPTAFEALHVAEGLLSLVHRNFEIEECQVDTSISLGFTVPSPSAKPSSLLSNAEIALRLAQASGGNTCRSHPQRVG